MFTSDLPELAVAAAIASGDDIFEVRLFPM